MLMGMIQSLPIPVRSSPSCICRASLECYHREKTWERRHYSSAMCWESVMLRNATVSSRGLLHSWSAFLMDLSEAARLQFLHLIPRSPYQLSRNRHQVKDLTLHWVLCTDCRTEDGYRTIIIGMRDVGSSLSLKWTSLIVAYTP
jgi:hypothetical protein